MELLHGGGMLQDDLRREGTRLHVPALLQFEQVPAVAQNDALREPFEDPGTPRRGTMGFLAGHRRPERGARLIVSRRSIVEHETYIGLGHSRGGAAGDHRREDLKAPSPVVRQTFFLRSLYAGQHGSHKIGHAPSHRSERDASLRRLRRTDFRTPLQDHLPHLRLHAGLLGPLNFDT